MGDLNPADASLLALIAQHVRSASPARSKRLAAGIRSVRGQEIAKAIIGSRTRSKKAKKTADAINRWAVKA